MKRYLAGAAVALVLGLAGCGNAANQAGNAAGWAGRTVGNAANATGQVAGDVANATGRAVGGAAGFTGNVVGNTIRGAGNMAGNAAGNGAGWANRAGTNASATMDNVGHVTQSIQFRPASKTAVLHLSWAAPTTGQANTATGRAGAAVQWAGSRLNNAVSATPRTPRTGTYPGTLAGTGMTGYTTVGNGTLNTVVLPRGWKLHVTTNANDMITFVPYNNRLAATTQRARGGAGLPAPTARSDAKFTANTPGQYAVVLTGGANSGVNGHVVALVTVSPSRTGAPTVVSRM